MGKQGKYNPLEVAHISSLFSYGEVPLRSSKLNTWNGNIEAALNWLTRCAVVLFGGQSADFILNENTGQELKVVALHPPEFKVRVHAGKAIVAGYLAGLDSSEVLPSSGQIVPPVGLPRYDRVCLDQYGDLSLIVGEESEEPVAPPTPAGSVSLALLYLPFGMDYIKDSNDGSNGYILDTRPPLLNGLAQRPSDDPAPAEMPDGARTHFSTARRFVAGSLDVYVNGVLQARSGVYAEDAERRGYTFSSAPPAGYQLQHRYRVESE